MQGLQDSHAKVRWAACQAIGQMCTDLAPEVQETEHARLLPALIAVMDDFDNPRVQAHSAAAVVNFTEGGSQVRFGPLSSNHFRSSVHLRAGAASVILNTLVFYKDNCKLYREYCFLTVYAL